MNHVKFKLRLHHSCSPVKVLSKWFRILFIDLEEDDDVYNIKQSYETISEKEKGKSSILFVNVEFNTPMKLEDFIEFISFYTEFENASIYTLYTVPVNIELVNDSFLYNKEIFYLQDLVFRDQKTKERLSELKYSWGQDQP